MDAGRRCSTDVAALEHVLVVGDGRDEVVVLQVLPHVPGLVLPEQESANANDHEQESVNATIMNEEINR